MAYSQGSIITANTVPDYNSLRDQINSVLADAYSGSTTEATANFGYGKAVVPAVSVGEVITAAHWNSLFTAVRTCATHQGISTGAVPVSVAAGDVIASYDGATTGLIDLVNDVIANRLIVGAGQSTATTSGTRLTSSRATAWAGTIEHEFTVNFGSYNAARYFFNTAGEIRLSASRSGGSATAINTAWANMLSGMGTIKFGHTATTKTGAVGAGTSIGFYNLNASYQTVYSATAVGYPVDSYALQAKTNSAGLVTFKAILTSSATVDGTVSNAVDDLRSTGAVVISAPAYATLVALGTGGAVGSIIATNDSASIPDTGGVVVANVRANDTLNGAAATSGNTTLSQISADTGLSLNTSTGAVTLTAGGATGTKTLVYQLCESANLGNCDSATVTVTVTASAGTLVATNDSGSIPDTGGVVVANVRANDTLNGAAATSGNTTLSQTSASAGVTLNTSTGAVSVAPGTSVGAKTLVYQICETAVPANCASATVNITVTASSATLVATNDSGTVPNGAAGGTAVANVRANDTVNGATATGANSTLTEISADAGVSLNTTTGAVTVAAGTTAGSKTLVYRLAELGNLSNTADATVTVTVNALSIVANNDTFGAIGAAGGIVGNVLTNDTFNAGAAAGNVTISNVVVTPTHAGVTIAANGDLTIAPSTTPASYSVDYRISQTGYTSNFDTATATLTVNSSFGPTLPPDIELCEAYDTAGSATVQAIFSLGNDGGFSYGTNINPNQTGSWMSGLDASLYEANGPGDAAWYNLGTGKSFLVEDSMTGGGTASANLIGTITIRRVADSVVMTTCDVDIKGRVNLECV